MAYESLLEGIWKVCVVYLHVACLSTFVIISCLRNNTVLNKICINFHNSARNSSHADSRSVDLICIGPCIILITEEKNPTRCHLLLHYAYVRLNMFLALLCPSSGAHDDSVGYHIGRLVLELLLDFILQSLSSLRLFHILYNCSQVPATDPHLQSSYLLASSVPYFN